MTIQPIGNASVALYITPADLKEHGLTPAGLTLERALELTRDAFHEAGITLDGSIEIEAYPNAGADQAAAQLSEFGRSEDGRPHLEARLAEHGRPVLSGDALGALLTYFPV